MNNNRKYCILPSLWLINIKNMDEKESVICQNKLPRSAHSDKIADDK